MSSQSEKQQKMLKALALDQYKFNKNFIQVDGDTVSFTIQNGPIGEVGVNGCQVDELISFARGILSSFQQEYPCKENERAIECLNQAQEWLQERKRKREESGVEGFNKKRTT